MPRVRPPEPNPKNDDRPSCPRCGGPVYKLPDYRHWYKGETIPLDDEHWPPRYVCKAGRKERTCGHYWRRRKDDGELFFEPTRVTADGYLEFNSSPMSLEWSNRNDNGLNVLVMVVRPKGVARYRVMYGVPRRPEPSTTWGTMGDWDDEFKEWLRERRHLFANIPDDVLEAKPRPVRWDPKTNRYRHLTPDELAEKELAEKELT